MNEQLRLEYAAKRSGEWDVSDRTTFAMRNQEFINNKRELFIQVTYSDIEVKGAQLWDFSDQIVTNAKNGVPHQQLFAKDRDKAARIEDVLLGNSRRF